MGLTCLDGNAPTLTNVTLESPGEETGHAESPAGAQWRTHSFGDAPKTASAQRFRHPNFHMHSHSTGMRMPLTKCSWACHSWSYLQFCCKNSIDPLT